MFDHQTFPVSRADTPHASPPDSPPASAPGTSSPGASLEVLETEICELAGHLAAATCRFLVLLAEFDARRGWAAWDMPSCTAWLSWKCQLSASAAREQVRVARALGGLPVIRGEFAAGRFSYAKVRALTRIATPESDADLAEMAGPMTANQLDKFARAHRTVTRADDATARLQRRLTWRLDDDGSLSLSVRLPPEDGAALLTALRAATQDTAPGDDHHGASAEAPPDSAAADADQRPAASAEARPGGGHVRPTSTSLADALVEIAEAYLAGKTRTAQNPDVYQVISLCKYHHRLIHDGTATIATPAPGIFTFYGRDGTLLLNSPPLPAPTGQLHETHDAEITPDTIVPPWYGERLDLDYAIAVLFANQQVRRARQEAALAA